jgi:hypothetical protein
VSKKPRVTMTIHEKDRGWKEFAAFIADIKRDQPHVKVGVLDDGGKGSDDHGGFTNAQLAAIHEFGSEDGTIPERSFIRSTLTANIQEYKRILTKIVRGIYMRKLTPERGLGLLGAQVAADIKKRVTTGDEVPPPNAPSTLARKEKLRRKGSKGLPRTLVDTGRMIGSVSWAVVKGVK